MIGEKNNHPLLSVEDLTVSFGTGRKPLRAVEDLSLEIHRGECIGLVGESGSGKSVTALAVMGLLRSPPARIEKGRILFKIPGEKARDLLELPPRAMRRIRGTRISMVFQDPVSSLNPFLTISEQMVETLRAHRRLSTREALKKAVSQLDRVGIPDAARRIDDYAHQFSGGMCQRILIAMSLMLDPDLVIADEPTTALDVTIQAQILDLLEILRKEKSASIMLITHDLGVVAEQTHRVLVIYAGRIVESASTQEIFQNPAHPYTAALHRSLPLLSAPRGVRLASIPGHPPFEGARHTGCAFAPRCEQALEKCRLERPPFIEIAPDHRASCWGLHC